MSDETFGWQESDSRAFIDYGRYYVPDREVQIQIMCDLIPRTEQPGTVLELCCGEGLLAAAILQQFPKLTVHGYDGSSEMLHAAQERLAAFDGRFHTCQFDLASYDWRTPARQPIAVVSSLTIHHLDGAEKLRLFQDVYKMLLPGGALIIADLIKPTTAVGVTVAATAWDEAVRARARRFDGHLGAFNQFKADKWNLYRYPEPDEETAVDKPSSLFDQLKWLEQAGFTTVDVYWMKAGHAIFGGQKVHSGISASQHVSTQY